MSLSSFAFASQSLLTSFRNHAHGAGTAIAATPFLFGPTTRAATLLQQFCKLTRLNRLSKNFCERLKVIGYDIMRCANEMEVKCFTVQKRFNFQQTITALDFLQVSLAIFESRAGRFLKLVLK